MEWNGRECEGYAWILPQKYGQRIKAQKITLETHLTVLTVRGHEILCSATCAPHDQRHCDRDNRALLTAGTRPGEEGRVSVPLDFTSFAAASAFQPNMLNEPAAFSLDPVSESSLSPSGNGNQAA